MAQKLYNTKFIVVNMVLLATILKLHTQHSITITIVLHEWKEKKPNCHPSRNLIQKPKAQTSMD
jgi:hypothetical protein